MRVLINKQSSVILSSLLILIIAAVFWPSLYNGFTHWDDNRFITENPAIRSLSWENIKSYFLDFENRGLYKPLVLASFAIEYHFVKLNPIVYHSTNLVFHILDALLVFWLFYKLTKKHWIAFTTALLFGIHPMHVESVAWVIERKDVFSAFFFFLSLISYISFSKASSAIKKRACFYGSFIFFLLSLFCKPIGVTMPMVLLLVDYFLKRGWSKEVFLEKIPFVLIAVIFSGLTIFILHTDKYYPAKVSLSFFSKVAVACYGFVFYLVKLFIPIKLSAIYPYPKGINTSLPTVFLASILLVIALVVILVFFGRRSRKIMFGGLFFIITSLPILQIVPNNPSIVCERYTYIPYLGIFYVLAEGLNWFFSKKTIKEKFSLVLACVAIVAILSFLTWQRCKVWRDDETLWTDVLNQYPKVWFAYNTRGAAYKEKGDFEKAVLDYNRSLELEPDYWEVLNNLGNLYFSRGDYERAIADYTHSIDLNPNLEEAYNNRANAYASLKEYDQALKDYSRALEINPNLAEVHSNRGNLYRVKGNLQQAIADYNEAIRLKPDYANAIVNRGTIYRLLGKKENAMEDYNEALRINPRLAQAYSNRANLYLAQNKLDNAIADYQHALSLDTHLPEPYLGMGLILESKGNRRAAVQAFKEYLKFAPSTNLNIMIIREKIERLETNL